MHAIIFSLKKYNILFCGSSMYVLLHYDLQQMTSIGICSTLAIAMGPFCKQHTRVIVPGLISCLSDSKVSADVLRYSRTLTILHC